MLSVWLRIADVDTNPWEMELVSSLAEATPLSSGDALLVIRWASRQRPSYTWDAVPSSQMLTFVVRGRPSTLN